MANTLYDEARKHFLEGNIDWMGDTIKVYLVSNNGYTVDVANHKNLDDVGSSGRIAGPVEIVNKATAKGAADGDDVTFTAVDSPKTINAILIYKEGANEGASPLIAYIDTATGLPITPNGGDIIVTWDNGTNKIFRV